MDPADLRLKNIVREGETTPEELLKITFYEE